MAMRYFSTIVTGVSDEARELIEGGVLILFAEGAPPELAEVSVLHRVQQQPTAAPPAVGAKLNVAGMSARITAIGEYAWRKIGEMGHVVVNFNDSADAPRPGEISAENIDRALLAKALHPGAEIWVES
jgi:PTS system glucitol/sorbitol-specific IIA component